METTNVTNLIFSTKLEFPDIGSSENLYIATDENAIYRFDLGQNGYVCLNEISDLKPVAFSGSYNDLTDIPDIEGILINIRSAISAIVEVSE